MAKKLEGKLRQVRYDDLIRCQDIIYACLNIACDDDRQNIELRKHYSFSNLEIFLANSRTFFVFTSAGRVLGMGRIDARNEVRTIYVDPACHLKGIGQRILAAIDQHARSIGLRRLYLHALTPAIGFYEKQGYIKAKDYKKKDNLMTKQL